jgi:hypothetical protein
MARRTTSQDPVIRAAALRLITGPTVVTPCGPVWHQRAAMCARGQLPCSGPGQDVTSVVLRDETPGRVGGKARLGDDHTLARPGGRDTGLHQLATPDIVVPAAAGSNPPQRPRETQPVPTRHQEDQATANRVGSRLTLAGRVAQRMLPPPLGSHGAIATPVQDPSCWRRQRAPRRPSPLRADGVGIPGGRPDHPPGRPIRPGRRPVGHEACARAFPRGPHQRADQPAEDQTMVRLRAAELPLARIQHLRYLAGDACVTPQVSRSWVYGDVGSIQQTQEHCCLQVCSRVRSCPRDSSPVTFE